METDFSQPAAILVLVGAVGYYTRLAVDLMRMYYKLSLITVILMLVIGGPAFALLFWLASEPTRSVQGLTQSTGASVILAGFAGAAASIAANSASSKAKPTKPPALPKANVGGV